MHGFWVALQFLTRIRLVPQEEVGEADFGASVKFFPAVGLVIGGMLGGAYMLYTFLFPPMVVAALLLVTEAVITGGLHLDGFMDTADGLFSGRSRERMLEIMRDSRVGAFGVMAAGLLFVLKFSLLAEMITGVVPALVLMPVLGRWGMVVAIAAFPYARSQGMGKSFHNYAGRKALLLAGIVTLGVVIWLKLAGIVLLAAVSLGAYVFGRMVTKQLGGLTGDVYGAITEVMEVLVLLVITVIEESVL